MDQTVCTHCTRYRHTRNCITRFTIIDIVVCCRCRRVFALFCALNLYPGRDRLLSMHNICILINLFLMHAALPSFLCNKMLHSYYIESGNNIDVFECVPVPFSLVVEFICCWFRRVSRLLRSSGHISMSTRYGFAHVLVFPFSYFHSWHSILAGRQVGLRTHSCTN